MCSAAAKCKASIVSPSNSLGCRESGSTVTRGSGEAFEDSRARESRQITKSAVGKNPEEEALGR
jgi:hypothetical protein